jgi:quercetin dioxygenase-like cupin family protein
MLFEESKKAYLKKADTNYYGERLKDIKKRMEETKDWRTIIKPEFMPWENSKQGIIKHLFNEKMDIHVESVDAYMQLIPPGSHSGKHRHMSEEYIFILEGKGYDLHWDVDFDLGEKYTWKVEEKASRWEWEQGDSIYIPPNTVHQHFNGDAAKPVRFISATSRMVRYIGFDDLEQIEDAPEYGKQHPAELLELLGVMR